MFILLRTIPSKIFFQPSPFFPFFSFVSWIYYIPTCFLFIITNISTFLLQICNIINEISYFHFIMSNFIFENTKKKNRTSLTNIEHKGRKTSIITRKLRNIEIYSQITETRSSNDSHLFLTPP